MGYVDVIGLICDGAAALNKETAPLYRFMKCLLSENNLVLVTTSHLLTEYIIDNMIQAKCSHPEIILDDKRNFSYFVKLNTLYCNGQVPEDIYKNLVLMNKLRNSYAHNLKPDPKITAYYEYPEKDGKKDTTKPLPSVKCDDPKDPEKYHLFLMGLCLTTLTAFANHAKQNGVEISYNEIVN